MNDVGDGSVTDQLLIQVDPTLQVVIGRGRKVRLQRGRDQRKTHAGALGEGDGSGEVHEHLLVSKTIWMGGRQIGIGRTRLSS